ncbi:HYDIN protein, partial [Corythaixoides concolor]|nr:HYDIN protein [Corythaixoides concolor]
QDYFHQITFITEREKFIVPIRAIGPRAMLDFPDQLDFSVCPVKHSTEKTLLVRNIGNREARYRISTESPFSIDVSAGTLGIGDAMQVTVEFHPLTTGDHSTPLLVHYDTGEDTHTSLCGTAVDVNIRLDSSSLTIEKTYVTLANHRSVVIHNRSNIVAQFQWKASVIQEVEEQQKQRFQEEQEECSLESTLQRHFGLLCRTFQQQRANMQGDSMLFSDGVFTIEPMEGEVQPNSSVEINVIFRPKEAKAYQKLFFCDISGRETRLPLCIKAEGLGPRLCFNFDQLDIGEVFMGLTHRYEAILLNKGLINAHFSFVPPTTAVGSGFTFQPNEGTILPDGLQVLKISFISTILGRFTEELRFSVDGSPEPVTLTIRGCVIGPTFHFNVPALHFGDVSFGFPRTLSCRLINTSLVSMTCSLRIPGDGSGAPSSTSSAWMLNRARPRWRKGTKSHARPTEFTITPCRGTIRALGFLDIQVTLCSNTPKRYDLALVVDVDGVGEAVSSLYLTARCFVPELQVLNPTVMFGGCFLKFPYQQTLTLVNDSSLPGCYRLLPQVCYHQKEGAAMWYSSPVQCGIIQPHSSVEVPLTVEVQAMGEQDTVAYVIVFGNEGSPLKIHLVCTGKGPVVYVYPSKIDFGSIPVLQDASQTLHLSNQTVIPAPFCVKMAGKCSHWRIEPSEGVVPPETELSVALIANLDDTRRFKDKVIVSVENSCSYDIPVQAVGVGTTIVADKPFPPELNLGPQFSLSSSFYRFKLTNKGRRTHQLYWVMEGFALWRQHGRLPPISSSRGKGSFQSPKPPVFKLQPRRMELAPGKTVEVTLEGFSSTSQVRFLAGCLCLSVVKADLRLLQALHCGLNPARFSPLTALTAFYEATRADKQPSDVLTLQYKPLSLKNLSSLPVSVVLTLEEPFIICDAEQQPLPADPIKLETGEELHLCIGFNPAYVNDLNIRVAKKILKIEFLEHPHKEKITIRGEVYFPNLHIKTTAVDFGCILNETEVKRCIEMTNCSPLCVRYRWFFLADGHTNQIRCVHLCPLLETALPGVLFVLCKDQGYGGACSRVVSPRPASCFLQPMVFVFQPLPSTAARLESTVKTRRPVGIKEVMELAETSLLTLGVEQVFDILPLFGELKPGESEQVIFTFFGHTNIVAGAVALCVVEGGPTYEVTLSGEASLVNYLLDVTEIDCGLQPFNKVTKAEVTLRNTGKMGFPYEVRNSSASAAGRPLPGVPLVVPSTGSVGPGTEQVLKVHYLPGVPGVFCKTFQIQVAHLEPQEISLKGEGRSPRTHLDLPRNI